MAKEHATKQPMAYQRKKKRNKKYLENNEYRNTMAQKFWDVGKAALRGMFIAIQAYFKKQAITQTI